MCVSSSRCSATAPRGGAWWFEDGWFLRHPEALLRALRRAVPRRRRLRVRGRPAPRVSCAPWMSPGTVPVRATTSDGVHGRGHGGHRRRARTPRSWRSSAATAVPLDTEAGTACSGRRKNNAPAKTRGRHSRPTRRSDAPCVFLRGGFIVTPMSGGVRSAGLVELAGTRPGREPLRAAGRRDAPLFLFVFTRPRARSVGRDKAKTKTRLRGWARATARRTGSGSGRRCDAHCSIGPSSRVPGVLYAFGHQHIGWTLGGITGARGRGPGDGTRPGGGPRAVQRAAVPGQSRGGRTRETAADQSRSRVMVVTASRVSSRYQSVIVS